MFIFTYSVVKLSSLSISRTSIYLLVLPLTQLNSSSKVLLYSYRQEFLERHQIMEAEVIEDPEDKEESNIELGDISNIGISSEGLKCLTGNNLSDLRTPLINLEC